MPSSRRSMSPDQNLKLTIDSTRSLLTTSVTAVAAAGERAYSSMADWMMALSDFLGPAAMDCHTFGRSATLDEWVNFRRVSSPVGQRFSMLVAVEGTRGAGEAWFRIAKTSS